jgi:prepilin signal peptidase PulO-like enzyme (type II secretory pathway)
VEFIYIFLTLALWISPPELLGFGIGLILLIYFGVVVVIDLEYRLILHPVSFFGGILGLIIGSWLHGILNTIIGGIAGFGIMFALYYLGALLAKVMAKARNQTIDEEALGFGDVMLGGVLGLLLGWPGIALGLVLAVLIGGIVSVFYILWLLVRGKYKTFIAIPYGPFLVAGSISLLYFRDLIIANFGN